MLDEEEFDKRALAQLCVEGIQARIADGDHYSGKVLKKAEEILEALSREQDSN